MISRLLAGTEWQEFAGYMSPAFLDALSPASLAQQLGGITGRYVTRRGFQAVKQAVGAMTSQAGIPVDVGHARDALDAAPPAGKARGDAILHLYFSQLLTLDVALLDLRGSSFTAQAGRLVWTPAPLFVTWSPEFVESVRELYRGFYAADDRSFRQALRSLGLAPAEAELRAHFGAGQRALRFSLAEFRRSMNAVFSAAVRAGARVAPEMLGLGIMLACLYEHLEGIGAAFDVEEAFFAAAAGSGGSR